MFWQSSTKVNSTCNSMAALVPLIRLSAVACVRSEGQNAEHKLCLGPSAVRLGRQCQPGCDVSLGQLRLLRLPPAIQLLYVLYVRLCLKKVPAGVENVLFRPLFAVSRVDDGA